MKRYIKYKQGQFVYDFEFLDINIFNRDSVIERELSLANSGVPNKVRLAASAGISPDKMFASQIWENEFLEIHSNWIPLQTSYTMSSKDAGRPSNSEGGDASDSTAESRDSGESEEV